MHEHEKEIEDLVGSIMAAELLAVLATKAPEYPYTNLVAFAATEDLKKLLFVTTRSTRKYLYLISDNRASLLIDNRSNSFIDFRDAVAINATGRVREVDRENYLHLGDIYLHKHPYLQEFFSSLSSALMCMDVEKYIIVRDFQNVVELDM